MIKSHARVVVIGGGILGCGLLCHLAKLGWGDVVLVEKNELTAGTNTAPDVIVRRLANGK